MRWGWSQVSVEILLSNSAQNFRKGILLCCRKFVVSKSFMDEKGGITFFRRKFLVSQCQKNSWACIRCFRNFGVSKLFFLIGLVAISISNFLSHSAEKLRIGTFWCFTSFGYQKTVKDNL